MNVTVTGRGTAEGLFRSLRPVTASSEAILDLSALTWCEPIGLVALAAFAEMRSQQGADVSIIAPHQPNRANYLSRMRLGSHLSRLGVQHDLPQVRERNGTSPLLELHRFNGDSESSSLAEMVFETVHSRGYTRQAEALYGGLEEFGRNVVDHSGVAGGYAAAQSTWQGGYLHFAVGDFGVGMHATMAPVGAATSLEAISMAVIEGKSGTQDATRGVGLSRMREDLVGLGGRLEIISGNAYFDVSSRGVTRRQSRVNAPGTLVQGVLRL